MPLTARITTKRQVTFPKQVLESLGLQPGDRIELQPGKGGYLLKPLRLDASRLGTLRGELPADLPPFDVRQFREGTWDASLRD
jgi:AbrB family looped-hinge helix DNA binding protein